MRAARMKMFNSLMQSFDSEGAQRSHDVSEVDLSDPEDVKVTVDDPQGAVLIHLGTSDFLTRYKIYLAHAAEWRQQFTKLESVDLRFDGQVIVNPDSHPQAGDAPTMKPRVVKLAPPKKIKPAAKARGKR